MNPQAFTQTDDAQWPSGYAEVIAVTRVRPELLARAFGLSFTEGHDNLDAYEAVTLRREASQRPSSKK